jgi:hypothetical protein
MESVEQTIRMNNLSKELRKYGFAQSSQDAIAQAGQIYGVKNEENSADLEAAQLSRSQMTELLNRMQRLWLFKENTDQKIGAIADQVVKVTDKLNELIKSISLIEMNQAVFDKKLNLLKEGIGDAPRHESRPEQRNEPRESRESRSYEEEDSRHVSESSSREKEFKKLDKPIDRNGVAPASVSIDKIFYCGNK